MGEVIRYTYSEMGHDVLSAFSIVATYKNSGLIDEYLLMWTLGGYSR
jgi:hypothetical protein